MKVKDSIKVTTVFQGPALCHIMCLFSYTMTFLEKKLILEKPYLCWENIRNNKLLFLKVKEIIRSRQHFKALCA